MNEFPKENLFLRHSGSISLSMPIPKDSKQIIFIGRFYDLFTSDPFCISKKCRETKLSDKAAARGASFILGIQ